MTADERWQPCPRGIVKRVAEQQRAAEQHQLMTRRAIFAGTAALLGTTAVLMFSPGTSEAALSCDQVRRLADDYRNQRLDRHQMALVDRHRQHCPPCDRLLTGSLPAQNV